VDVMVFSQPGVKSASRELRLNATMMIKLEWFYTFLRIGAEAFVRSFAYLD